MYLIAFLIVVTILLFLAIVIIHVRFYKNFANGTWIDREGNILVLETKGLKLSMSFGILNDDSTYEFSEKKYNSLFLPGLRPSRYTIVVNKKIKINIDVVKGTATVYISGKKVGKFAKNNLLID